MEACLRLQFGKVEDTEEELHMHAQTVPHARLYVTASVL